MYYSVKQKKMLCAILRGALYPFFFLWLIICDLDLCIVIMCGQLLEILVEKKERKYRLFTNPYPPRFSGTYGRQGKELYLITCLLRQQTFWLNPCWLLKNGNRQIISPRRLNLLYLPSEVRRPNENFPSCWVGAWDSNSFCGGYGWTINTTNNTNIKQRFSLKISCGLNSSI